MKRSLIFLSILYMITCFSCQKDSSELVGKTDPVLLTRLVVFDSSIYTQLLDTVWTYDFTYDDDNRVVNIRNRHVNHLQPNFEYTVTYLVAYNGSDSMPYRVIRNVSGLTSQILDTTYLFYANGKRIRDSIVAGINSPQLHYYTYYSDRLIDSFYYYRSGLSPDYGVGIYWQQFSNSVLSHQHDSITTFNVNSTPPNIYYNMNNYDYTLTSHPDPLYPIIRKVGKPYVLDSDWTYESLPAYANKYLPITFVHNTESSISNGGSSSATNTSTYHYLFRMDGYPLVMWQLDDQLGTNDPYYKVEYSYNR